MKKGKRFGRCERSFQGSLSGRLVAKETFGTCRFGQGQGCVAPSRWLSRHDFKNTHIHSPSDSPHISGLTMSSNNFAPYQDVAPDVTRSLSPPPNSPPLPRSTSPRVPSLQHQNIAQIRSISPPTAPSYQNQDYYDYPQNDSLQEGGLGGRSGGGLWSQRSGMDLYETSLGMRLDWEACLAYLGLPPAGAALLLMFEHRSDYVR
jgi:hypothetical protein